MHVAIINTCKFVYIDKCIYEIKSFAGIKRFIYDDIYLYILCSLIVVLLIKIDLFNWSCCIKTAMQFINPYEDIVRLR